MKHSYIKIPLIVGSDTKPKPLRNVSCMQCINIQYNKLNWYLIK